MTATTDQATPLAALNFEQLLKRSLPEKDYPICLDGPARAAVLDAEIAHDYARARLSLEARSTPLQAALLAEVTEAEERLEQARKDALPHTVNIRLRGLNRSDFDEIQSRWPPSDDEKALAKKENRAPDRFDLEMFGPGLIAACVVRPEITFEQAQQLWSADGWTGNDVLDLFNACRELCQTGGSVDLGNASRSTRNSESTSTSASGARRASRTRGTSAASTDGPTETEPKPEPG